jgi:hypothetical protein
VPENRPLRGVRAWEGKGNRRLGKKLLNYELRNLCSILIIIRMIKLMEIRCMGRAECMGEMRN